MKRYLALILILVSQLCVAQYRTDYGELEDSELTAAMKRQVRYLSAAALEGRGAGTEGELEAARYVTEQLRAAGIDVISGDDGDLFGMKQENGDTLRSHNVIGFIPGYDKKLKNKYILISARLDNLGTITVNKDGEQVSQTFYGANGNASGLTMLMQLAERLNTNKVLLKRSIIIAAFGSSLKDNAGAWYFLNRSFKASSDIDAMIDLEMVGTGSRGFYAYTASNQDLNTAITDLSSTLQPVQPTIVAREPVKSDHRMFYAKEIPAVMFTTGMYPEYNTEKDTESILEYDEMERELEYIYNFTVKLANGGKPEFNPSVALKGRYQGSDTVPFYECDTKPTFLGSSDIRMFLVKWVYVYLRYPREAMQNGIQGRVLCDFVVDERGKVRDVKVVKGCDELLDAEAIRVISASPDWKPGKMHGQKVRTEVSLYVDFKLEKKK